MKQELKKRYIYYICFFIVIGMLTYMLSPAPEPTKNMREAQGEIDSIEKVIEFDSRFSELNVSPSAGGSGTDIWITGRVPDKESIDYLKSIIEKRISEKFNLQYHIQIKENPEDPNEPISG